MEKSCKYCDSINPDHTSSEHHDSFTKQFCDLITKVTISHDCDESIGKNILLWVKTSQPIVLAK